MNVYAGHSYVIPPHHIFGVEIAPFNLTMCGVRTSVPRFRSRAEKDSLFWSLPTLGDLFMGRACPPQRCRALLAALGPEQER